MSPPCAKGRQLVIAVALFNKTNGITDQVQFLLRVAKQIANCTSAGFLSLLKRFWAKGPFPSPFDSVGTPSSDTTGDQSGLPVVWDEYT